MERQEAAAAGDLPFDLIDVFLRGQVRGFFVEVAVAAVGDDHDRIGRVERRRVCGPAVPVVFDGDLIADIRVVEHHLQELDRPRVVVDAVPFRAVALLTGDQDDLLLAIDLGGSRRPASQQYRCRQRCTQTD